MIWLFRRFTENATEAEQEDLANWILSRTRNEYLPFGSSNLGAKSVGELAAYRERLGARKARIAEAESNRATESQRRRVRRATENIFGAIRRHDLAAVESLLQQGADLLTTDAEGRTPEALAKELGYADIASRIAGRGSIDSAGTV